MEDNKLNEIQELIINYPEQKKEEETFESKMDSLFKQLDAQKEKVKALINIDIEQNESTQNKFVYDLNDHEFNIINNKDHLIEIKKESEQKIEEIKRNQEEALIQKEKEILKKEDNPKIQEKEEENKISNDFQINIDNNTIDYLENSWII